MSVGSCCPLTHSFFKFSLGSKRTRKHSKEVKLRIKLCISSCGQFRFHQKVITSAWYTQPDAVRAQIVDLLFFLRCYLAQGYQKIWNLVLSLNTPNNYFRPVIFSKSKLYRWSFKIYPVFDPFFIIPTTVRQD